MRKNVRVLKDGGAPVIHLVNVYQPGLKPFIFQKGSILPCAQISDSGGLITFRNNGTLDLIFLCFHFAREVTTIKILPFLIEKQSFVRRHISSFFFDPVRSICPVRITI